MSDTSYRPRGEAPPDELRRVVVALLADHGPRDLARRLGISRDAVLGVAAGCRALPGTLALLRERLPAIAETAPSGGDW
jgi:hypothetical protein